MDYAGDDDGSGAAAVTEAPPGDDYNHNTTAILLAVAFVVAAAAVGLCYAVARRKQNPADVPEQKYAMRMGILTEDLQVPDPGDHYLSLQVGGRKDTKA